MSDDDDNNNGNDNEIPFSPGDWLIDKKNQVNQDNTEG
jgi:hypothetical protein